MYNVGLREYFSETWNYFDMLYIFSSISQVILHFFLGPFNTLSRMTMIMVILLSMGKTFFFLRIFD